MNDNDSRTVRGLARNLAMIAVLLGIGAMGYFAAERVRAKSELRVVPDKSCDLRFKACSVRIPGGGALEVSVSPRPIVASLPFRIEARTSGMAVKRIEADFAGETMNMGLHRISLERSGAGRYGGETALPVCISGKMNWVVTLAVESDRQLISAPFTLTLGD